MNQSDTERIQAVIEAMGYEETPREEDAELLGIVACSVRQKAIDKVYSKIHQWNKWKNSKSLLTFVSGCILPADREKFLDRFDLLFSINELPDLPEMISQYGITTPFSGGQFAKDMDLAPAAPSEPAASPGRPVGPMWLKDPRESQVLKLVDHQDSSAKLPSGESLNHRNALYGDENRRENTLSAIRAMQNEVKNRGGGEKVKRSILPDASGSGAPDPMSGFWNIKPHYRSPFEAFIPIQNGCDKFCTFCAVPYTRGREVSRPSSEILAEVEDLLNRGYKSITLLGQNVNSYGLDKERDEIRFPELMRRIGEMGRDLGKEDDFLVYFTSPHPRDMTRDLLEIIAEYRCLAKQIHLPLQSGDDKLLIKMNRNHSLQRYREIVENIREILPEATLFTDIIVGFTGETEEQFQRTRRAMEEFQYNMAFVAMYSPRPGAASSRWDDDIPQDEKKRRLHVLSEELQKSSLAYNRLLVGRNMRVLVEGRDRSGRYLAGRSEGKLPVRFLHDDDSLIGQFVQLRISSASELSLEGELIETQVPGEVRRA
ncbi:tRNA-i(6)A37 methylthiotransferase [Salinispira pacifica]|uniref:tRNA-2-methylthio-N(6)-dimethylallyladenosine synthase n=2 Tax=Salinispira pacifica TaxID=1307761 RepID=V5WK51_9SPIO|nr:tRNA-i(6)A37 methylthiotransferase [Salinispira pacifica]